MVMIAISVAEAFGPAMDAARSPETRVRTKLTTRTVRHTEAASHSLRHINDSIIEPGGSHAAILLCPKQKLSSKPLEKFEELLPLLCARHGTSSRREIVGQMLDLVSGGNNSSDGRIAE